MAELVKAVSDDFLNAGAGDFEQFVGAHGPQITPRDERVLRERLVDSTQRSYSELMRRPTSLDNRDGDFAPSDGGDNVDFVIEFEDMRSRWHQSA